MPLPKVALITAGSAGLGAAVARVLALDLGMSVIINYSQNAQRAQDLVKELREGYLKRTEERNSTQAPIFHAVQADLSRRAEIARLVEETTMATNGRLDVVISNVGWTMVRNFSDLDDGLDEQDWDTCFNVNVKSHLWLFHATRRFLEESNAREEGAAVFVSTASVAGVKPSGSSLPYAVSKAAQIHLIKSLATISAPTLRVNSVSPGLLMTEWGLSFPKDRIKATKEQNKLQRLATVEDVADQIKVLVQAKTVTGQNIVIDAGFTL